MNTPASVTMTLPMTLPTPVTLQNGGIHQLSLTGLSGSGGREISGNSASPFLCGVGPFVRVFDVVALDVDIVNEVFACSSNWNEQSGLPIVSCIVELISVVSRRHQVTVFLRNGMLAGAFDETAKKFKESLDQP